MKKLTLLIAALFTLSFGVVSAQTAEEAVAKFKEGAAKAQNKQFAEAAVDYEAALAMAEKVEGQEELVNTIKQQLPTIYLYQGVTAIKAKDFTTSISSLEKAEKVAGEFGIMNVKKQASRYLSLAYQTKGAEAFNQKDYKLALESFEKGYAKDPTNVKLANLTAKSYAELGDINKASEIYNKVIADNSQNEKYTAEVNTAKMELEQYYLVEGTKFVNNKDLKGLEGFADGIAANSEGVQLLTIQLANSLAKYDDVIARAEAAAGKQTIADNKSTIYLMLGAAYQNKDNKAKALEALKKVTSGESVAQAKSLIAELSK